MNCNLEDLDKDQPEDYWKTIGPRADKKKEYKTKYKDPLSYMWKTRGPTPSRLIQLAFHDCLKH